MVDGSQEFPAQESVNNASSEYDKQVGKLLKQQMRASAEQRGVSQALIAATESLIDAMEDFSTRPHATLHGFLNNLGSPEGDYTNQLTDFVLAGGTIMDASGYEEKIGNLKYLAFIGGDGSTPLLSMTTKSTDKEFPPIFDKGNQYTFGGESQEAFPQSVRALLSEPNLSYAIIPMETLPVNIGKISLQPEHMHAPTAIYRIAFHYNPNTPPQGALKQLFSPNR